MSVDQHSLEFAAPRTKSDLGVRTLSATVMVVVAGGALWLGGYVWTVFVVLVAVGVLWEWAKLAYRITPDPALRAVWFIVGVAYVGVAAEMLWQQPFYDILLIVLCVIATDIGAYFTGRAFGGPKIAPKISPSKTWAGLVGGMIFAGLALYIWLSLEFYWQASLGRFVIPFNLAAALAVGALVAIIAQTGDFFESWMKRRAGVKDSGNLIPGHGGLFDRVDGLLAVLFVMGIVGVVRLL